MRKAVFFMVIFSFSSLMVFADGGGGAFYGQQRSSFPFFEEQAIPHNTYGLAYYGGYGYGISSGNSLTGGFGMAIIDPTGTAGITGGFGGVMNGVRLLRRPVNLQVINCAALGGVATFDGGFFGFFDELTVELGIPLSSWFMPAIYVGYQVIGEFTPGEGLVRMFSYTPVIGIRIGWGRFF